MTEPLPVIEPLLSIRDLSIDAPTEFGEPVRLVERISLTVAPGERVALVGESGSGKSVTARAVLGLDRALRRSGSIRYDGRELVGLGESAMRSVRGAEIGMVFQDPMGALNPLMTIGKHISGPLRARGIGRREAEKRAVATLQELGVERAAERMHAYPHEFSGGMRQRVVLAMALVNEPRLLIADEPTTALDVRVQAQVLELIAGVAASRGLAVLFITHDVGVVGELADRVQVMYAGTCVERASVDDFFGRPQHPYTRGLLAAVPRLESDGRLVPLNGAPPSPADRPVGCVFADRCPWAQEICRTERPALRTDGAGRDVRCHFAFVDGVLGAAAAAKEALA
jgi:oligopeptide/dipeptide ABC transporter ATP-binding protein